MNRTWAWRLGLGFTALLLLMAGLTPAWHLWQTHEAQWLELAQQRQAMLADQEAMQAMQNKALPSPVEAQALISTISQQRLSAAVRPMTGLNVSVTLNDVGAQQLAQAWSDIRKQTSASVTQADLVLGPQGWSGTLTFKLAQRP